MGLWERIKGDIVFFQSVSRSLRRTATIAKHPSRILPFVIDELAQRFGEAPALLGSRETFSYRDLAERTNKYARRARTSDAIHFNDRRHNAFVRLDGALHQRIIDGKVRL